MQVYFAHLAFSAAIKEIMSRIDDDLRRISPKIAGNCHHAIPLG